MSTRAAVAERTLALLADLSQALTQTLDLDLTLRAAVSRIADALEAEAASVFLLDDSRTFLECRACAGPASILGRRLELGVGVVGRAFAENACQLVRDVRSDPDFSGLVDAESGFTTRSILCAPLASARGPIGVLQVLNHRGGGLFDEQDRMVLQLLAGPTALAASNAALARALVGQDRIRRELKLARQMQKSMLPKRRRAGFPLRGMNLPAREMSGDFYDYFELADGRIAFSIGDVAGKGLDAALLMVRTASLLRWAGKEALAPAEWLARANQEVCETISRGLFVCAAVGYFDPAQRSVTFASAGFPPALYQAQDGSYQEFLADGPPLGVVPGLAFAQRTLALGDGSLYFFSDGVTDVRDSRRRTLGLAGVRDLIERHRGATPDVRLRAMLAELKRLSLPDDTTVLLLEDRRNTTRSGKLLALAFPARADELHGMRLALAAALDAQGVAPAARDQMVLAVHEAACNVIRHAYHNDERGRIELALSRQGDTLEFALRDYAPCVDPVGVHPRDLSECRPGGLGVNFIDALMDEWRLGRPQQGSGNLMVMRKKLTTVKA